MRQFCRALCCIHAVAQLYEGASAQAASAWLPCMQTGRAAAAAARGRPPPPKPVQQLPHYLKQLANQARMCAETALSCPY